MPPIASNELQLAIDEQRVIGIPGDASSPTRTLLYVTSSEAADKPNETPIYVHVAELEPDQIAEVGERIPAISKADCVLSSTPISVIVSTGSGTKQSAPFFEHALKPLLTAYGLTENDYEVYTTESEHSVVELTRATFGPKAAAGVRQAIILLSGDGGTIDVMNELIPFAKAADFVRPILVTLPLGSGNALSNSYRYNDDKTVGLSTLLSGSARPLPMFRARFSDGARLVVDEGRKEKDLAVHDGVPTMFGAVVCSWGLHSTLVADSDTAHYRQFGSARFGMVAKELLFPPDDQPSHSYQGTVTISPGAIPDRDGHSYVLATLVTNLEKTFCISPDSKKLDGKLRLVEMPSMPGQELMELMMAGYNDGKHVDSDKVGYHAIDQLEIVFNEDDARWRRVCVDGKIIKMEKGGKLQVCKEELVVADLVVKA